MQFEITAVISQGAEEWTENLGTRYAASRRGLTSVIHALHTQSQLTKRFTAREITTGERLMYRQGAGGWFEPVGKVYGGPFKGFEG